MASTIFRLAMALCLTTFMGGCGGGTSPTALADATTTRTLTVSAKTLKMSGQEATRFEEGEAFEVVATVVETTRTVSQGRTLSETSGPAVNATVTATVTGGQVQPGSALTGADGVARFRVTAGEVAGAFQVDLATSSPAATGSVTTRLPYMVERTFRPDARLEITDASGNAVGAVRPGQQVRANVELRRARVTALGIPDRYEPATNVRVGFSAEAGSFDPAFSAATTDANGRASILFVPPVRSGPIRLSAAAEVDGKSVAASGIVEVRVPQIYLGAGQPFQPGVLVIDPPEIEAGASARISAQLVDQEGRAFEEPVIVDFTSTCAGTDAASITSPVLAAGGVVATSYRAGQGCAAADLITADFLVPGIEQPVRAQGLIRIRPPQAEGIAYVEASNLSIMLRGMGSDTRPDRATLTFRVTNAAGIPVRDAMVDFAVVNPLGALTLENASAATDVEGSAIARVRAGDVPGVFRVRATVRGTGQSADSATLVVSTGRADQDSFSLSFETLNIEGSSFDGVTTQVSVRAGDRLQNPVADGTAIYFTAEGGLIAPECRTVAGTCSVILQSSNPRPTDGRVTVLARTEGTESWRDANGNGLFDSGEAFDDRGEVFRDDNEDGVRSAGELFFDANGNGSFDIANGRLDGGPCAAGVQCGRDFEARASGTVVFSTSAALVNIYLSRSTVDEISPTGFVVAVSDRNGNLPPAGTQIQVAASKGTLTGDADFTVLNTNARGPIVLPFSLLGDGSATPGSITVRVVTPRGVVTTASERVEFESACAGTVLPRPPGCAGGGVVTVASLTATPSVINIAAGATRTENVEVRVLGQANPPAPIRGLTPSFSCSSADSTGISVTVPDGIAATNDAGVTTLGLEVSATATASGATVCTLSAGGVSTRLTIEGPPVASTTAGAILLTPATITAQPGTMINTSVLVTLRNALTPAGPLVGVTPALRCTTAGSTGLAVTSGAIAPTNAAGQTEIPLAITASAGPVGSVQCEVTSGTARATFAIQG